MDPEVVRAFFEGIKELVVTIFSFAGVVFFSVLMLGGFDVDRGPE